MAKPNIKFIDVEDPYKIRCGERRILTLQVKPRAVGTCTLTVFLKAETCFFGGGNKEITQTFEVTDSSEKRETDINLVMMGSRPITYSLNLNVKVENADGDENDDFILVKLDCRNPMKESEQTVEFTQEELTEVIVPVAEPDAPEPLADIIEEELDEDILTEVEPTEEEDEETTEEEDNGEPDNDEEDTEEEDENN